jgi:hypothetical protein
MQALYRNGVWAIFSALDPRALQFKPGILADRELCDEILHRLDASIGQAVSEIRGSARKSWTKPRKTVPATEAA